MKFKVEIEDWLIEMMKEEIKDERDIDAPGYYDIDEEDITGHIYGWLINAMARDSMMFKIHIFNGSGLKVDVLDE